MRTKKEIRLGIEMIDRKMYKAIPGWKAIKPRDLKIMRIALKWVLEEE